MSRSHRSDYVKSTPWGRRALYVVGGIAVITGSMFFLRLYPLAFPAAIPFPDAKYLDDALPVEERVNDLLRYMTLEEKIGQMTLVEKNSLPNTADVATYHIGAVLSGAGGNPDDNTPQGWKVMVAEFTDSARRTRLGIPLLYGSDANHGFGNVPGATIFPHSIGLGAANDSALVERVARATADESAAMGIRWSFSPMLELPEDIRWGRVYEAFSDDADRVGTLGAAYVHGLQDSPAHAEDIDVLATAKHYVGLGSLVWGTAVNKEYSIDQGVVPSNEKALQNEYLPPYKEAIEAGAMSVMAAIGVWDGVQIPASRYLLTDVLKDQLGFQGFVVSDWYGIYNISPDTYYATVAAVNAGVDMAMLPFDYEKFARDMENAILVGDISQARVDDAVRRILRAKFAMGLFDDEVYTPPAIEGVGSANHRALAREAVRDSLVLLRNQGGILPLSPTTNHIRVAGSAADNVGMQSGGWTVEWQGIDGNWLPGATSILSGIRSAVSEETTLEYDLLGNFSGAEIADVGIAIVGEKPYSEGVGDNALPSLSADDLAAIEGLKRTSKKVVVILISGRPLIVTDEVSTWNAIVAAWLPGSEGAGVADVLFGTFPFTGTLPLVWPRSVGGNTSALFPRGYGL